MHTITAEEAARRVREANALLIDVREPDEWAETGVAEPAILLAMSDLAGARREWGPFLEAHGDRELIFYCRSGGRSGRVATALAHAGYRTENAGGFSDWLAAGLPVRPADSAGLKEPGTP